MSQKLPVRNLHMRNLKQALNHGLNLENGHRVIKFNLKDKAIY